MGDRSSNSTATSGHFRASPMNKGTTNPRPKIAEYFTTLLLISAFFAWLFRWQITDTRYGLSGAWILLPAVLIITAIILSVYYGRRFIHLQPAWDRIGIAIILGVVSTIVAIVASEFISQLLWGAPPHISGP